MRTHVSCTVNKNPRKVTSVGDPWHFGADPDPHPHLWLMDPDPGPPPDPTPFLSDFKDAKKKFFLHSLPITYPQAHYLQSSKLVFLLNFVLNPILQALFQTAQHFLEKREGSGSAPLTNGSRSNTGSDSFLQWLRGCKKNYIFHIFFLITYPQAHYLQS